MGGAGDAAAVAAATGLSQETLAAAVDALRQGLAACEAGAGAVSAPRVLALLLERLGADSQVQRYLFYIQAKELLIQRCNGPEPLRL